MLPHPVNRQVLRCSRCLKSTVLTLDELLRCGWEERWPQCCGRDMGLPKRQPTSNTDDEPPARTYF